MTPPDDVQKIAVGLQYDLDCDPFETNEEDTSCSDVPIGFVRVAFISPAQKSDHFWVACVHADSALDLNKAESKMADLGAVKEMLQIARSDLDRVKKQTPLPNVKEIEKAFELEGACLGCAGAVLLLKTSKGAAYVHWHRES
ncbi:hypothetical protein [Marinobacter nauticus]|uniref:hypothetical protein n=1 Tax=Marinobacter nauticus TaxID=2743 RepID=UPI001C94364F|nr:hypothetical protein [Marinobacter nauticus]MBY6222754.1 hypothetical protein [Marinobacter nauticus]